MVQPKCNTVSIIISIGGLTPLHNAARNGHSEDNFGLTPLHDAAKDTFSDFNIFDLIMSILFSIHLTN